MITIKQVWLAIVALLTSFALLSICAFATGDSNASASSDAMSMDASGNAFIRVNVYKDFNDIYKNDVYQTIYVPSGTDNVDQYLVPPTREFYSFVKWRLYDTKAETFDVNDIKADSVCVYGTWSSIYPVSSDADTSSEESEYAKATCYVDYEAYKNGQSCGSVNIKKGYDADSILDAVKRNDYIFCRWEYIDASGNATNSTMDSNKSAYGVWEGPVPNSGVSEDASANASFDASGNPLAKVTYYKTFEDYKKNVVYKEIYANRYTDEKSLVSDPEEVNDEFLYWSYVENGVKVSSPTYKSHVYAYGVWRGQTAPVDTKESYYAQLRDSTKIKLKSVKRNKKSLKLNLICKTGVDSIGDVNCEVCYWIKGKPKTKKTISFLKNKSNRTTFGLKKLKSKKKYSVKVRVKATYNDVEYVSKWSKTYNYKTK